MKNLPEICWHLSITCETVTVVVSFVGMFLQRWVSSPTPNLFRIQNCSSLTLVSTLQLAKEETDSVERTVISSSNYVVFTFVQRILAKVRCANTMERWGLIESGNKKYTCRLSGRNTSHISAEIILSLELKKKINKCFVLLIAVPMDMKRKHSASLITVGMSWYSRLC